ncbi:MAG: pyruvate dehydrogenase [Bdellovibrio sp. ArHS]|uniref:dihydrolipoyllysine-residue acetyltransferase n=1 Tax=Bdellovibrio sp. ArHS TaxID=1569284 RepID=UPI0005823CE0|nr:dihydrolipoyllysine-residue acetyltransferase [Bdellovibrio sp. ArHS]KHD89858.1 MAG: pyruvate dehydrogenase [Bdellovibrio sp. ArHS]
MATEVKLPELGEGVTEGELVKWLVKPGDSVKADQPIAEVLTDKATVEVPSPVAGVVKDLKFKAGDVVKVGSTMITLEGGASAAASAPAAKPAAPTASTPAPQAAKPAAGGGKVQDIKLPELGEGVTEGELVKWLVKPGDSVKADQAIAEVLTDKATVEVPTPVAGIVKDLKFKTGEVVKVGSTMITLEGGAGAAPSAPTAQPPAGAQREVPASAHANFAAAHSPSHSAAVSTHSASGAIFPPVADSKVLATPATRRLAREMGVDINSLNGSGLAGRVTREDVLSAKGGAPMAAKAPAATPGLSIPKPAYQGPAGAAEERVPLIGIRKKIAENMQRSKHVIPHFTIMDEAKVDAMVAMRESLKEHAEKNGTKITYLPIVMKALIATIREFPMFNASIDDAAGEIVYKKYFNLGFAADTPNGLVVPVIKNADQKTILEISKEILDLSKRARDGKLKPDEMKGATITVTNIGSIGGTYATPVINHPEVAILGMYKIDEKPVIKDGQLKAIKVMNYTMTADHRLIDGAIAARFLAAFIARIENPAKLLVELV